MKNKIILALLCVTLFCQSLTVFAENTEYDANENYTSSDELSNDSERTKIPIEGLDNCYILDDGSGFYVNIVMRLCQLYGRDSCSIQVCRNDKMIMII